MYYYQSKSQRQYDAYGVNKFKILHTVYVSYFCDFSEVLHVPLQIKRKYKTTNISYVKENNNK